MTDPIRPDPTEPCRICGQHPAREALVPGTTIPVVECENLAPWVDGNPDTRWREDSVWRREAHRPRNVTPPLRSRPLPPNANRHPSIRTSLIRAANILRADTLLLDRRFALSVATLLTDTANMDSCDETHLRLALNVAAAVQASLDGP